MKRIFSFVMMGLIFLFSSVYCFAEEYSENTEGYAYAKYNHFSGVSNMNTSVVSNGAASVVIDDGTNVTVTLNGYDGLVLIVHQITESEADAYRWFKKILPVTVEKFVPYDIYLLDSTGKRVELPGAAKIKITVSSGRVYVLGVSANETVTPIDSSVSNGAIFFKSIGENNYYVLCQKHESISSPSTGDTSNTCFWLMMFLVSALCMITVRKKVIVKNNIER